MKRGDISTILRETFPAIFPLYILSEYKYFFKKCLTFVSPLVTLTPDRPTSTPGCSFFTVPVALLFRGCRVLEFVLPAYRLRRRPEGFFSFGTYTITVHPGYAVHLIQLFP